MRAMAGQTAGPIKTKLGMGIHVDPVSVLGKVKVKVMWRHLAHVNKTPYSYANALVKTEAKIERRTGSEKRIVLEFLPES